MKNIDKKLPSKELESPNLRIICHSKEVENCKLPSDLVLNSEIQEIGTNGYAILCKECQKHFFICKSCYRGHRYCSQNCKKSIRKEKTKEAQQKYQKTFSAKQKHAARQRQYKKVKIESKKIKAEINQISKKNQGFEIDYKKKVTHHSSFIEKDKLELPDINKNIEKNYCFICHKRIFFQGR